MRPRRPAPIDLARVPSAEGELDQPRQFATIGITSGPDDLMLWEAHRQDWARRLPNDFLHDATPWHVRT